MRICNRHSARHDPDRAFKNAHMDVQIEAVYILCTEQSGCKSDDRRVVGAQKFFHPTGITGKPVICRDQRIKKPENKIAVNQLEQMKPHEKLAAVLADDMAQVNGLIRSRMASKHAPRIPEVTAHLVEAGGKRLRPMLTLAAARMCGYTGPYHLHLAATVEFIHTATLLHDDVVDESEKRRGRTTANLLWDNKSSVLVGDYLFSRSFQLMVETGSLRVLDILANASATIAEGEVLQLTAASDLATDESIYLQVVRGKTAALFSAATEVGGVIAGADEAITQALYDFGDALGVCFQIVDDLLDYSGATNSLGKNVGDDFRERKLTLPVIKAVAKADAEERALGERTITKGRQEDGDLDHALALMAKHDTLQATRQEALLWAERAKLALGKLPDHSLRDLLMDVSDFVVSRVT